MLSSNEESVAHGNICVANIKEEPVDNIDWIIEENIHSDEEDDSSSHVNDKQEIVVKKELDETVVTQLPDSPPCKLKRKCVSKQNENLSKVLRFNSHVSSFKENALSKQCSEETASDRVTQNSIKIEQNVSKDVLEGNNCGIKIKEEPSEVNDSTCHNSDGFHLQSYPEHDLFNFVGGNASLRVPIRTSNSSELLTNDRKNSNSTLRNMLMSVPIVEINSSTSIEYQANNSKPQRTFSNKAWLPRLTELIKSKPKISYNSEDVEGCSQVSSNVPVGMNTKYDQLLNDLVCRPTSKRSGIDDNQETNPKLLTTQTLSSLLANKTDHLKPTMNEPLYDQHFDCEECDKSFGTFPSLVAHKKYHRMRQKLVCTTCQKEFTVRREYERHQKKHSEPVELVCPVCDKSFSVVGALKRHMLIHGQQPTREDKFYADDLYGEGLEKCIICEEKFSKYYIKHHMKIHSTDRPYMCKRCGKTFAHKQSLVAHKLKHKREMMVWNCEICDRIFDYEYLLKRHMKLHTKYKCDKCDKTLRNRASYLSHWRTHNNSSYCCVVCKRTYSRYSAYFSHYQSHNNVDHLPLPENTGNITSESSSQTDPGNDDNLTAVDKSEDEMVDNQELTAENSVENDPLTEVTDDKSHESLGTSQPDVDSRRNDFIPIPNCNSKKYQTPHTCHICGWDATSPCALKRHMRVHEPKAIKGDNVTVEITNMYKEGVIQCPVCDERFSKYYIKNHMKIHSNDRPYCCDICDKSFVYKSSLASHVVKHQTETVVLYCELCDRTFDHQHSLNRHMKTHDSHIFDSMKSKDSLSSRGNSVSSSGTCLPQPTIEIDNVEEETTSKDIFNIVFEISKRKDGSTVITKLKHDEVLDGRDEDNQSVNSDDQKCNSVASTEVDQTFKDHVQCGVESKDNVFKDPEPTDDHETSPSEQHCCEDRNSDSDLDLKVQFATD
ncbi:zinc finger protein 235-like isoform X1 [Gigantopelta aegis]|uniref:zinc finger protein 235-like isoform X1 n=1 Tax=Gigantopelta aegis TaxID=1735272 RepID=UPI001B88C800|nr:zinc finger protein 235-like isoform X1 [Gigantopelta aegis]